MVKPKSNSKPVQKTKWERLWPFLNSPLIITVLSAVVIAGAARLYTDHQEAERDRQARRSAYATLLPEFEHRVAALVTADARLNPLLGEGTKFKHAKKIPDNGSERDALDRLLHDVGQEERDILRGKGTYIPTSPEFSGVNFGLISLRLEDLAGIPDLQIGAMRLLGFFDADSDVIWLFVRSYIPTMQQVSASRHLLFADGRIPFPRNHTLTAQEERSLGWPDFKLADLEKMQKENDRLHATIQSLRD